MLQIWCWIDFVLVGRGKRAETARQGEQRQLQPLISSCWAAKGFDHIWQLTLRSIGSCPVCGKQVEVRTIALDCWNETVSYRNYQEPGLSHESTFMIIYACIFLSMARGDFPLFSTTLARFKEMHTIMESSDEEDLCMLMHDSKSTMTPRRNCETCGEI